jgi:hypothetical protein
VEVTTRAVNVEALKLCSAYRVREISKQRTTSGAGTLPKHMWKKFSAYPRSGGRYRGQAPAAALVGRHDSGHFGQRGEGLGAVGGGAAVVLRGVLGAEEADRGAEHVHGVAGLGQPGQQFQGGAVEGAQGAFAGLEVAKLYRVGELAVPEEVGDLLEGAAGGEVLDRVASVGAGVGLLG